MALFSLTTLLSAFLLFQIQPLIARVILPSFGGTPAVWTTCMLFFQALLVGGYGYGHVVATKLVPRRQALVHTVLVTGALGVLGLAALRWGSPLVPPSSWRPDASGAPILEIVRLLFITVGVPYLVLSTTGPLVQSWARLGALSSGWTGSPYRLYALSNVGSLAGLLLYPTVIEPLFGLRSQAWFFSALFLSFGLSVIGCGRLVAGVPATAVTDAPATADGPTPGLPRYLGWAGLASVASALLLSITNQLCQDVAAIPLLWVVPLSLYLISFILAFDRPAWYPRWLWMPMYAAAAAAAIYFLPRTTMRVGVQIPVWSALLLSGCMVCHGELARSRPQPRYLTGFWFAVSVGGAIGGLFVSVIAPKTMTGYFEVHVAIAAGAIALCVALLLDRQSPLHRGSRIVGALGIGAILFNVAWLLARRPLAKHEQLVYLAAGVLTVFIGVLLALMPRGTSLGGDDPFWARIGLPVALAALLVALGAHVQRANRGTLFVSRSFFGVLRVTEDDAEDPAHHRRLLTHGRIVHGFQLLTPNGPHTPCTYYEPNSGIGRAIRMHPRRAQGSLSLGMCGLGTGTVASYTKPGDTLRFYEIDPAVVALSRGEHPWFRYLADAYGKVDVVLGDARVSLQRELEERGSNAFDVLAVDAFSGDAIPVHLLTQEAVALYMKHLKPDGVLALHISNRHIALLPVVKAIAEALGLHWMLVDTSYPDEDIIPWDSSWVLVGRDQATLAPFGKPDDPGQVTPVRPFTDEYSNIMKLLRL
jgi:hypothetical protein